MEYIKEFTIEEAVIHIIDMNSPEPVLNEFTLELNDEAYTYLYKHIGKCLKDEELKYGRFLVEQGNPVLELSQEFFKGEKDILKTSKELTSRFFGKLKGNSNVDSFDVIVASITSDLGRLLAILKMEYTKNYIHSIDVVEGKLDIKITPQLIGLPPGSQKLKCCCFLKETLKDSNYDLMYIDKEEKSLFLEMFIKCENIESEREMTKNFVKVAEDWTRKSFKEKAESAEVVRTAIKKKLKEEDTLDVKELSKEIFKGQEDTQRDFMDYVQSKGINDKVIVDREWMDKKLRRIRLKVDKDIDLYIDEETYNNDKKFEIQRNGDGTINMVIKHVTNYIEK